jgi:hypothetical protein
MKKRFLISEKQLKFIVDNFDLLNEQEEITRSLPTIDFNNSFLDNMVRIYQNDNLTNALSELDKNIVDSREKSDERLRSITITINAGSSTPKATNSLPSGVNHPDHDYDGLLSMNICEKGKKDKCWLPSSRRDERVNITNGNTYLANQRANNLKVYLEKYLKTKYGDAQITINIKDVNESTTKFASAVIDSIVFKKPVEPKYPYYILANARRRKSDGKYFIPVSGSKVWGTKKLNTNNDFTKEKAQGLLGKVITDRESIVIENPDLAKTQGFDYFGYNVPYIEVLDSVSQVVDKQAKDIIYFWFDDYNKWNTEKNNIQKYMVGTSSEHSEINVSGCASFTTRKCEAESSQKLKPKPKI